MFDYASAVGEHYRRSTSRMLFNTNCGALAQLMSLGIFAVAVAAPSSKEVKPPAFFLAGDSTTAIQTSGGGGTF
jgi:hypothetical protein